MVRCRWLPLKRSYNLGRPLSWLDIKEARALLDALASRAGQMTLMDIYRASAEASAPTRAPADRIRALRTMVASRAAAN